VLVAIGMLSLLPSERLTLNLLDCWSAAAAVADVNAREAALDDRTHAVPSHRVAQRQKTDMIANQGTVRGASAGATWSARSQTVLVPPVVAKDLLMTRCAADAVRAGLALASEICLTSADRLAPAVATSVQFLC
jgi:hypothetical protein